MAVGQCFDIILMKVSAEIVHKAVGIVLEHEHLPPMGLAHAVALEPIFITTRLLTHLTIPSQLCKALSFDAVAYGFRGEEPATLFCLAHSSHALQSAPQRLSKQPSLTRCHREESHGM